MQALDAIDLHVMGHWGLLHLCCGPCRTLYVCLVEEPEPLAKCLWLRDKDLAGFHCTKMMELPFLRWGLYVEVSR